MKLKMLREHYRSKDNKTWTPKYGFATEAEVSQRLGASLSLYNVYMCNYCSKFHISPGSRKYK